MAGANRWQWSLSIAHEGDATVAVALAVVGTASLRDGREDIASEETRAENGDLELMPLDKEEQDTHDFKGHPTRSCRPS